jgi:hypothetical protein
MGPNWLQSLLVYIGMMWIPYLLLRWAEKQRWLPAFMKVRRGARDGRGRDLRAAGPPPGRPFELVAKDVRRLARQFRNPIPGTSYVKREAVRHAYDRVLGEAADELGIDHLLQVLGPGTELDRERDRVEAQLWLAGLRVDDAA